MHHAYSTRRLLSNIGVDVTQAIKKKKKKKKKKKRKRNVTASRAGSR